MGEVVELFGDGIDDEVVRRLEVFLEDVKAGKYREVSVVGETRAGGAYALLTHRDLMRVVGTLETVKAFAVQRAIADLGWGRER